MGYSYYGPCFRHRRLWKAQTQASFRKTVPVNKGTTIAAVNVTIQVDNSFRLYIQGTAIGSSSVSTILHYYLVNLKHPVTGPGSVVIAFDGDNTDKPIGPAGFGGIFTLLGTGPSGSGPQSVIFYGRIVESC